MLTLATIPLRWRRRIWRAVAVGSLLQRSATIHIPVPLPAPPRFYVEADAAHTADERELADTSRSARETLFDSLFGEMERSVYGYLWRILGDQQTAADLTQETFLRVWKSIETISGYERPEAWVWRVATNLALNERRRLTNWRPQSLDAGSEWLAASDPAMRVAVHDQVHATLLALPARLRAALTLREVYGLSFEEVGRALDISPANARVTLSRAREQFRQRYQRTEGER